MKTDLFIGTWRLVSFELRREDGHVVYLFGKNAVGYIMYNEDRYMSVAFMASNRPKFTSGDIMRGTTDEKASAAETYFSYCGRYDVKGDKIIHHIEVSLFPNWTGGKQERFYKFDGDRLILSTPPMLVDGVQQSAHLVWERVTSK